MSSPQQFIDDAVLNELPKEQKDRVLTYVRGIMDQNEDKWADHFQQRNASGETAFHEREAGKIHDAPSLRFVNIMTQTKACGCPVAGIAVKDWLCEWTPNTYLDAMDEMKGLDYNWMANLSKNFRKIMGSSRSLRDLYAHGPVCKNDDCENLRCWRDKRRWAKSESRELSVYEGKPAYIVGSGPSLEKNVHELKNVNRGVVIAMNGSVPLLDRFDIFFSIDWKGREDWWRNRDKFVGTIGCLMWGCAPQLTELPFKELRWFGQMGKMSWDRWIRSVYPWMDELDRGFTGTFSAMQFALLMGCDPIVMVGCDASYGKNKWAHAGTHEEPDPSQVLMQVNDIHGDLVWTSHMHYLQNAHLRGASMWAALHGVKVINATEGGILYFPGHDEFIKVQNLASVVKEQNNVGQHRSDRVDAGCPVQVA